MSRNKNGRIEHQSRIAKEAGKSFESVVKDYANLGHSIHETAILLGYSDHVCFFRLCDRHGWRDWFKKGEETIGAKRAREKRRGMSTPGTRRAARIALLKNPNYRPFEYQGVIDTWTGHAKRQGVPIATVRKRKKRRPGDLDYIFSKRSHHKPRPMGKDHPWQRYYREREKNAES